MCFDPASVKQFRFVSYNFDQPTSTVSLRYAFEPGPVFEERFTFHNLPEQLSAERKEALEHCLFYLHLMVGISYYKAAVPPEIVVETGSLSESEAAFFEKIYLYGLGEFAHQNDLDLRGEIRFPVSQVEKKPCLFKLSNATAIPVGGGKDSNVTIEALRNMKTPVRLFSIGNPKAIREVSEASGLERIRVTRKLSPVLLELNKQGALNGHIPISAIIAFTLAVSAVLYDFSYAALSNERSANVGNFVKDGFEINHQYSKSLEFERDFEELMQASILPSFQYFSFLRPLSELGIAKLFAKGTRYHDVFTSCNKAFRIDASKRVERWCLDCPKCCFTFLCLAPFIPKHRMIEIYGKNLLNDPTQSAGFDALLGIGAHKPFECVGEIEESLAAFVLLTRLDEWKDSVLVQRFESQTLGKLSQVEKLIEDALIPADEHLLSPLFLEHLNAYRCV